MIEGHGDDIYKYKDIRINFSSNVYNHFNHDRLFSFLKGQINKVRNYPDPSASSLQEALSFNMGINTQEVMVCNGATEAIYLIAQTYRGANSLILEPTFSEYADACLNQKHKITYIRQFLKDTYGFDIIWLCCPNNPTGTIIDKEELVTGIKHNPDTLFVIDASYAPFTDKPLITPSWAAKQPNVLMIHSMTKRFAIPGLRVGYISGSSDLLKDIRRCQMPWAVNMLAQEAGLYLLHHQEDYIIDLKELIKERARMSQELEATGIVEVIPSDSHILLCRLRKGKASSLKDYLASNHGILIRDASNFMGLSSSHFRIAVQSREEDDELIKGIKAWTTVNCS